APVDAKAAAPRPHRHPARRFRPHRRDGARQGGSACGRRIRQRPRGRCGEYTHPCPAARVARRSILAAPAPPANVRAFPPRTATMTSNSPNPPLGPLSWLIFSSRWLQLPLYLGLIVAQCVYVFLFGKEL